MEFIHIAKVLAISIEKNAIEPYSAINDGLEGVLPPSTHDGDVLFCIPTVCVHLLQNVRVSLHDVVFRGLVRLQVAIDNSHTEPHV